ncbi:MAG: sialidase family protein [Pirellulaceae bacterium]
MTHAVAWFLVVLGATTGQLEWDAAAREGPGFKTPIQLANGDILAASTVLLSPAGRAVQCYRSPDLGRTWTPLGEIVRDTTPTVDLGDGTLLVVFTTDEDRSEPGVCAIRRLDLDIKYVVSRDNGATWLTPKAVIVPAAYEERIMWRYTTAAPVADWNLREFDARSWSEGPAGFGTEGTPGMFIGTPWLTSDIWLRRTFYLQDTLPKHPRLRVYHNEDAEIYINGVLALRLVGYATGYQYYPLSVEARKALRPGDNLIAVHGHQTTGAQYIDVGLHDLHNIIDEDHPILFPGVCEVKSQDGSTAVLVQYSRPPTNRTKRGVLGQSAQAP